MSSVIIPVSSSPIFANHTYSPFALFINFLLAFNTSKLSASLMYLNTQRLAYFSICSGYTSTLLSERLSKMIISNLHIMELITLSMNVPTDL